MIWQTQGRKFLDKSLSLTISVLLAQLTATQTCLADDAAIAARLSQQARDESVELQSRLAALKHINQALTLMPKQAIYWYQKADILSRLEEDEEALPCVEKAVQLDPKLNIAWGVKAIILNNLGKNPEALIAINKAIALIDYPSEHLTKAAILFRLHQPDAAEKELDNVVKQDPTNTLYRGRRAQMAAKAKHWDKVIGDYTFLVKNEGHGKLSYIEHLAGRAEAYTSTKQYDLAIADYKTAIKLVPDQRTLHQGLLDAFKLSGQKDGERREAAILKKLDGDLRPM